MSHIESNIKLSNSNNNSKSKPFYPINIPKSKSPIKSILKTNARVYQSKNKQQKSFSNVSKKPVRVALRDQNILKTNDNLSKNYKSHSISEYLKSISPKSNNYNCNSGSPNSQKQSPMRSMNQNRNIRQNPPHIGFGSSVISYASLPRMCAGSSLAGKSSYKDIEALQILTNNNTRICDIKQWNQLTKNLKYNSTHCYWRLHLSWIAHNWRNINGRHLNNKDLLQHNIMNIHVCKHKICRKITSVSFVPRHMGLCYNEFCSTLPLTIYSTQLFNVLYSMTGIKLFCHLYLNGGRAAQLVPNIIYSMAY